MGQIDVGRVFFDVPEVEHRGIPSTIRIIPLSCHAGNVARLASHWRCSAQPQCRDSAEISLWEGTRAQVLSAAWRHDLAKPDTFKITYHEARREFGYSFAGHRFRVPPKEPYEDALIKGHHDFSVEDIITAAYDLRMTMTAANEEHRDTSNDATSLLNHSRDLVQRYRDDLYILEMCDQIEASLESLLLDFQEYEPRNFMDFSLFRPEELGAGSHQVDQAGKSSTQSGSLQGQLLLFGANDDQIPLDHRIMVDPCPWLDALGDDGLSMEFTFIDLPLPDELQMTLAEWIDQDKGDRAARELQSWILGALEHAEPSQLSAQLLPLPQTNRGPTQEQLGEILSFSELNPMQSDVCDAMGDLDEGVAMLLRSPTGSGKTEAVLWPCLMSRRRLFLVLPTRSLLDDHAMRIEAILRRAARAVGRHYTMIIDTGVETKQLLFTPSGQESGKARHLYRGDVILTTLDKLVYRYFGYQDKTKSMIFPHRIEQSNALLCFDEAHSYDGLAWSNFRMLVQSLYEVGKDLIVMTATMPERLISAFEGFDRIDYVESEAAERLALWSKETRGADVPWSPEKRLAWRSSGVDFEDGLTDFEQEQRYEIALAGALVEEAKKAVGSGAIRVIVIANTVSTAIEVYRQLEEVGYDTPELPLLLYHGRLASRRWRTPASGGRRHRSPVIAPRVRCYQKLKEREQEGLGYLLITTHAIEVGCDLDAQVMITAFCPPDGLIQRAGRCNRKAQHQDAALVVVGERSPSYLNTLTDEQEEMYLTAIQSAAGGMFEACDYMPFLGRVETVDDPRQVEIFRMLYEYVYEGDVLHRQLHQRGLIATRSWEPSVTVRITHGSCTDEVSVPLTRLKLRRVEGEIEVVDPALATYERKYLPAFGEYQDAELRGGDAYAKREIIVEIVGEFLCASTDSELGCTKYYDESLGLYELPRVFEIWHHRAAMKLMAKDVSHKSQSTSTPILFFLAPYDTE